MIRVKVKWCFKIAKTLDSLKLQITYLNNPIVGAIIDTVLVAEPMRIAILN